MEAGLEQANLKNTVTLVILDGWGHAPDGNANAVSLAHTPNFDRIVKECPGGFLEAHGPAVGLPEGQMGNSEVGHTTIGAGRVVWMDLPKIDRAISDGSLAQNTALLSTIAKTKAAGGVMHIAGLVSDGGVHAHENHIRALIEICLENNVEVALHIITDGRDVAPDHAKTALPKFLETLPKQTRIATVCGRFYALDRDNRWERVGAAYDGIVNAKGIKVDAPMDAVEKAHANGDTDEFVPPSVVGDYAGVQNGDGLIFANFRADRAREILAAMAAPQFDGFERELPKWSAVTGMVSYSNAHDEYMNVLFPKDNIAETLGATVAKAGMTQFRLAETEKYPHVTFFMNGGEETPNECETRYMAPSPKVRTYDRKPEMSANEVGDQLEAAIATGEYDLIICNFANPDMVGHTGDITAAIKACEAVDAGLGRAVAACETRGCKMIVTADHGNCEVMIDPDTGGPHTAHTLNPVRYTVVGYNGEVRPNGGLADLAPTLLRLLELDQPSLMGGECLLKS